MKENKKDLRRQWPSGELTEAVIKKDVQTRLLPGAIAFTVVAVLLCVVLVPVLMKESNVSLKLAALILGAAFSIWKAYRDWSALLAKREYKIVEDKILGKRIESDTDKKDARVSDLSTRIPILDLEKHGAYAIDAEQIHDYYIPLQLIHDFQEQEEVYMVYDKKSGKLLRIYRKKYWTLPQE